MLTHIVHFVAVQTNMNVCWLHLSLRGVFLSKYDVMLYQGAYKFGKIKFPKFSMFSGLYKPSFPDNYKLKTQYYKSA